MNIKCAEYYNVEKNRMELILVNYECNDGAERIMEIMKSKFHDRMIEKTEGHFYKKIIMKACNYYYCLMWYDGIGNYIYILNERGYEELKEKVKYAVDKIDKRRKCAV